MPSASEARPRHSPMAGRVPQNCGSVPGLPPLPDSAQPLQQRMASNETRRATDRRHRTGQRGGMKDEEADARAVNAEPWEPLPGMVKREFPEYQYFFAAPAIEPEGCPAPIALPTAPGRYCPTMANPGAPNTDWLAMRRDERLHPRLGLRVDLRFRFGRRVVTIADFRSSLAGALAVTPLPAAYRACSGRREVRALP